MPPRLRQKPRARKNRIRQDRKDQRSTAANPVAQPSKDRPANRPAEQKRRLNPRAVIADAFVRRCSSEQFGNKWPWDPRMQMHVQAGEQPTQPAWDTGFALRSRQVL